MHCKFVLHSLTVVCTCDALRVRVAPNRLTAYDIAKGMAVSYDEGGDGARFEKDMLVEYLKAVQVPCALCRSVHAKLRARFYGYV